MNLPNKLTMLRMCLVPVMVVFFFLGGTTFMAISTVVFTIAAATDFLDGHIARKNNIVTDFGKFLDPIADKILVVTALILILDFAIIPIPYFSAICLIIVVGREFVVSGLRLIASTNGTVIAADKLGKLKTVTQIVAIILLMVACSLSPFFEATTILTAPFSYEIFEILVWIGTAIYGLSTFIAIISGIQYLVKNKSAYMNMK